MIAPAPRKPIPVTIWAAIRVGSSVMPLSRGELEVAPGVGGHDREERGADRDEHVRPETGLALPDLPLGSDRAAEHAGEDDAHENLSEVRAQARTASTASRCAAPISSIPPAARSSSSSSCSRSSGARSAVA